MGAVGGYIYGHISSAQTNRCSLIYSFIFTHHGGQMHALLIRFQIRIQFRILSLLPHNDYLPRGCNCTLPALKDTLYSLYTPFELERGVAVGVILGNASAKQRQVKNVFSFLCFRFFESAWKLQAAAAVVAADAAQWAKNCENSSKKSWSQKIR